MFIIVGLVLLAGFLMTIALSNSLTTSKLDEEKSRLYTEILQQEGLRLFVEDCLEDSLDEGLNLLGKQGGFWADQPGGKVAFSKDLGIKVPGEAENEGGRVKYSISKELEVAPNQYPCNDGIPPEFCKYEFPDISVGFGKRAYSVSTVEKELKNFLINKTTECANLFVLEKITDEAVIESASVNMDLDFKTDVILIDANIPLRFSVKGQEFFTDSSFDLLYKTNFKQFLISVVSPAVYYDVRNVDFNLTKETLESASFKYKKMDEVTDLEVEKETPLNSPLKAFNTEMKVDHLSNGDTLFTFIATDFFYRVARQNRPPALDYVGKNSCDGKYDYLVVPGSSDLDKIEIDLFAIDPDEDDKLSYKIDPSEFGQGIVDGTHFDFKPIDTVKKEYKIFVEAKDFYGLADKQEVRVLVDEPLELSVNLSLPYTIEKADGSLISYADFVEEKEKVFWISKEDPVELKVEFPDNIKADKIKIKYTYLDQEGVDLSGSINSLIPAGSLFDELTDDGKIELDAEGTYCGGNTKVSGNQLAKVEVKACVPHRNASYPWSGDFGDLEYELDSDGNTDFTKPLGKNTNADINLATHACCAADWTLKGAETECYDSGVLGCYRNAPETKLVSGPDGYVLEEEYAVCDGLSGNSCGSKKYRLVGGTLTCGNKDLAVCGNIEPKCADKEAYSFFKNEGVCLGIMGCEVNKFCTTEAVYNTGGKLPNEVQNLAQRALKNPSTDGSIPTNAKDLGFVCGCKKETVLGTCDANFDGVFKGRCEEKTTGVFECVESS